MNDRRDVLVESLVRDFNSKFNSFMADFGCTALLSKIGYFSNIRYLAYKCGLYIQDLIKLTCTDIINRVYDEGKFHVKEENAMVAEQVKELVYVGDRMEEWLLERGEIDDIIYYLYIE